MQFPVPIPVFSLWASPPKCICYLTCTSTTLAQATTISLLSWIPVASELVLLLCPHSIHSIPIVASACTLWKHRSDHITPLLNPPPNISHLIPSVVGVHAIPPRTHALHTQSSLPNPIPNRAASLSLLKLTRRCGPSQMIT